MFPFDDVIMQQITNNVHDSVDLLFFKGDHAFNQLCYENAWEL